MKYLINKSGELHSCIAIENFEFNENEFHLIETEIKPPYIRNKWTGTDWEDITTDEDIIVEIPQSISPAEFTFGLALQDITDAEVLDFIDNHIEDETMQLKARILFTKATEFEYGNPLLIAFFPPFSQYINKPINYDNIFINGITLNT